MDVTRWSPPIAPSQALSAPVTARLVRGWQKRESASAARMDRLSGFQLEKSSLWATYRPLWLCLLLFVQRSNSFGDPGRCPLSSEDGKTRSWQQRRDDHQPPLRTLLSAGRGIQRAPPWRGVPEAVDPQSLRGWQAAEDGSNWRSSQEAPAQTQPKTPLRGDGDSGQRHLRESEKSGGESKPEDSECFSLWVCVCVCVLMLY